MFFKELIEKYIFPPALYCIACGSIIDRSRRYLLCDECMKEFRWITGAACKTCGKSLGPAIAQAEESGLPLPELCYDCTKSARSFERGYSCFSYNSRAKAPILGLKYGDMAYAGAALGRILTDKLLAEIGEDGVIPWDCIVPVPIHPDRERTRGYNQAALIGAELSKNISVPLRTDILLRVRPTSKMNGLTPEERASNLEGAFQISPAALRGGICQGKTILLLDDIYTTGATAENCSQALLSAGASHVHIATIASGANFFKEVL